jgi:hypothetical protein
MSWLSTGGDDVPFRSSGGLWRFEVCPARPKVPFCGVAEHRAGAAGCRAEAVARRAPAEPLRPEEPMLVRRRPTRRELSSRFACQEQTRTPPRPTTTVEAQTALMVCAPTRSSRSRSGTISLVAGQTCSPPNGSCGCSAMNVASRFVLSAPSLAHGSSIRLYSSEGLAGQHSARAGEGTTIDAGRAGLGSSSQRNCAERGGGGYRASGRRDSAQLGLFEER